MKLSRNLSLQECTKSNTAIRLGLDNNPDKNQISCLIDIAQDLFQPLRDHFRVPIGVSSGFRSAELNRAISGSDRSQHCKGQALDLDADIHGLITNKQIFEYIKDNLEFDQLIWEFGNDVTPDWVHVSYKSENNRGEVLQAVRQNGRVIYKIWG